MEDGVDHVNIESGIWSETRKRLRQACGEHLVEHLGELLNRVVSGRRLWRVRVFFLDPLRLRRRGWRGGHCDLDRLAHGDDGASKDCSEHMVCSSRFLRFRFEFYFNLLIAFANSCYL